MDSMSHTEIPSLSRRRLSTVLPSSITESTKRMSMRRLSMLSLNSDSSSRQMSRVNSVSQVEDNDEGGSTNRQNSLASVLGMRASTTSRILALPTISKSFQERNIRPTLINAMIFLSNPKPDINKMRSLLTERLLMIPRFRSIFQIEQQKHDKKRWWGGGGKKPSPSVVNWVPIPRSQIDMSYHVQAMDGKGTFEYEEISTLISQSFISDWDATRPLWKVTLVSNLKDGRSLFYCVIDHAIGDGVTLLRVLLSLLDDPIPTNNQDGDKDISRKNTPLQRRRDPLKLSQSMRLSHKTITFLYGCYTGIIGTLVPTVDPRCSLSIPFNRLYDPCLSNSKTFTQTRPFDLVELKRMKNALQGVTINDLVMAIITMALKRYFIKTNDAVWTELVSKTWKRKRMNASFPINNRSNVPTTDDNGIPEFGNNFSIGNLALPLAEYADGDPIDAVWKCKALIDEIKLSPGIKIQKAVIDLSLAIIPEHMLIQSMAEGVNSATCMMSNVIGPPDQSFMGGYEVDDMTFTASANIGLYLGILSFGGSLRITAITDGRTNARTSILKECLDSAHGELKDAILAKVRELSDGNDESVLIYQPNSTPRIARLLETTVLFGGIVGIALILASVLNK